MGGKKKTLANRLAKMSDEERARYLQKKADMEEEAKRRKEQLIATFMKNKIKKEDAFSRLNLAKINQHWHQILRSNKCRQMKEDVEHMKRSIERVLEYKNRTIQKLLEDLDIAERQYLRNFESHSSHIDQALDSNNVYLDKLGDQFKKDLDEIIEVGRIEEAELVHSANDQEMYLRTIIHGQEVLAKKHAEERKEKLMESRDEIVANFHLELESMVRSREDVCCALWREIAGVFDVSIRRNDERRRHLAELRALDAESALEIAQNQERIRTQEAEIKFLQDKYANLTAEREDQIQQLEKELKELNRRSLSVKAQLQSDISKDQKKLFTLTSASNQAIDVLEKLKSKGDQIIMLMGTCRKFETQREQVTKWLPIYDISNDSVEADKISKDPSKAKIRPKTSFAPGDSQKSATPPSEPAINSIEKVVIGEKTTAFTTSPPDDDLDVDETGSLIGSTFRPLLDMDRFWMVFCKVEVDFRELKKERKLLREQNKQYRGTIRAVLEAASLAQSIPHSRVSTRLPSKSRSASSAPLRRVVF